MRRLKHSLMTRRDRFVWGARVAAFALCLGVACAAVAEPVAFGVKLGAVLSDQDYDYDDGTFAYNPRSSVGPVMGLFVAMAHTPFLSSRLDVLYIRKGSEIKVLEPSPAELKDEISYLSLSPQLKAAVPLGPGSPFVVAGPRLDIKLGGDSELNAVASNGLESTVWGMTVGCGYQIPIAGTRYMFVEIVYHGDFSDAYEFTRLNVRNRAVVLTAGMSF